MVAWASRSGLTLVNGSSSSKILTSFWWYLTMPTVLRIKGYRFFFFSLEGHEPPHVHVESAERVARFWLRPVALAKLRGFRRNELTEIRWLVEENVVLIEERWHEHFGH